MVHQLIIRQDSSSFITQEALLTLISNDYNLWLLNIDPSNLDNHCNYNFVEKLTYDFNSNGEYDSNDLFQDDNDNNRFGIIIMVIVKILNNFMILIITELMILKKNY